MSHPKIHLKAEKVDDIRVQMTVTFTVGQWKLLQKAIKDNQTGTWPLFEFLRTIRELTEAYDIHIQADIEKST